MVLADSRYCPRPGCLAKAFEGGHNKLRTHITNNHQGWCQVKGTGQRECERHNRSETAHTDLFVAISFQYVIDAMEQNPDHPFSQLVARRAAIIAPTAAQTDAPAAATEEFFFRLGTTGYLNLKEPDARTVSRRLRNCRVQLDTPKIERTLQRLFEFKPSRSQNQGVQRSERLRLNEMQRLRDAYANWVSFPNLYHVNCLLIQFIN